MINEKWHQNLINDVKHFQTLTENEAVLKVIKFLKNAKVIWEYNYNHILSYKSLYHLSSISSSIIKMSNSNLINNLKLNKGSDIFQETYMLEFFYKQLILHFPIIDNKKHLDIFYYHFLNDYSYHQMLNKKLYTQSKKKFFQDKNEILTILKKAWLFDKTSTCIYEDKNSNLYKKLKGHL